MIAVYYSNHFIRSARKISDSHQEKLAGLVRLIQQDPFHPKLHTKCLAGKLYGLFSFRITRDWRVIFKFLSSREIQLVDIAHRKDIYK